MKFEELKDKLCKVFHVDVSKNKLLIIYRYPTVVQPTIMKYELVPITDDEDMKIIFATVSSHLYISGAELYIDVQPIEDTRPISNLNDYEVADWDIPITTQGSERTDNVHVMDSDELDPIIR